MLDLPPPYLENTLREGGDAFARAILLAEAGAGAGNLVWVRRYDSADCAVILEPEEPLASARLVILAGLVALAEALRALGPEGARVALRWPDAVLLDGRPVGGARIATPACDEAETPDWLVFGFTLRMVAEGEAPAAALADAGFVGLETATLIEGFARALMQVLDDWADAGGQAVADRFTALAGQAAGADLRAALASPSWLADGEIAP